MLSTFACWKKTHPHSRHVFIHAVTQHAFRNTRHLLTSDADHKANSKAQLTVDLLAVLPTRVRSQVSSSQVVAVSFDRRAMGVRERGLVFMTFHDLAVAVTSTSK